MKKLISIILAALMAASVFAALPSAAAAASKPSVKLSKTSAVLKIYKKNGKTVYGSTKIKLLKSKGVTLLKVSYKSSNSKVSVKKSGTVTAKKAGKSNIAVKVKYSYFKKKAGRKAKKVTCSESLTFKVTVKDTRKKNPAVPETTETPTQPSSQETESAAQYIESESTTDPAEYQPTDASSAVEEPSDTVQETTQDTEPAETESAPETTAAQEIFESETESPSETETFFETETVTETETASQTETASEYETETEPYNGIPPYSGEQWIDKSQITPNENASIFEEVTIIKIYSDCFIARITNPLTAYIKVNGALSDYWCVGDPVCCTCDNLYYDAQKNRFEADLIEVTETDAYWDRYICYKPVIYLYPEEETDVSVKLDLNGKFTCTYPTYGDGWDVTAYPDGTLKDSKGTLYSYLFWEAKLNADYDFSKGFCVKGSDTAAFLEDALAKLGLNRREANEFIVFWLEKMQKNPFNIISFQQQAYTDAAKLNIAPNPDTLIRVFMAWYPADEYTELPAQELSAPERNGFTVVEWGGTKVSR